MAEEERLTRKKTGLGVLAFILWAGTSAASFVLIPTVLDMVARIYAAFWGGSDFYGRSYWGIVAIRQFLAIPLAVLSIGVIIGGAEYHTKHFNRPASWKLFARTFAAEVALFVMAAIV
jgi:hypothetical protein